MPLGNDRGRWMAATLTAPDSVLSYASAAAAWGWWDRERPVEVVTRRGSGGPRRQDGVLVHFTGQLDDDVGGSASRSRASLERSST